MVSTILQLSLELGSLSSGLPRVLSVYILSIYIYLHVYLYLYLYKCVMFLSCMGITNTTVPP